MILELAQQQTTKGYEITMINYLLKYQIWGLVIFDFFVYGDRVEEL